MGDARIAASGAPPRVSVVVATYNRSNVLAWCVRSVLRQSFEDWELWVVGDACTDDTAKVVESFGDPRVRFVNLEKNVGDQSGPNNAGIARARGRYVAFLNHDDLWFSDHLATAVDAIESSGADLVHTLLDIVRAGDNRWRPERLCGVGPGLRFDPRVAVQASCWLFRRELAREIGPWRTARECRVVPSEDWIYRAWRAGKDLRAVPALTVLAFPSGRRAGCYVERQEDEQRAWYGRLQADEAAVRTRELSEIATAYRMHDPRFRRSRTLLAEVVVNLAMRVSMRLGLHPFTLQRIFSGVGKGDRINLLRRVRGLPPLDSTAPGNTTSGD